MSKEKAQPSKSRLLYGDKIRLDFYENPWHKYEINGKRIISVTSATGMLNKPALVYWSANLARDFLLEKLRGTETESPTVITEEMVVEAAKQHTIRKTEAATSGTMVHEWAEKYIKAKIDGTPPPEMPEDDKVINGTTAFLKWVDEHEIEFIASELLVYSKKYKYAGLMDCKFTIGKDENHKIIHCGDFKTSKGIYNEMRYQVAAYQEADAEEDDIIYGDKWIIRFDKETAEFEAKSFDEHDKDFNAFLGLLEVKRREDALKI